MTGDIHEWVGRKRRVADEMATPLVRRMAALTDRGDIALDRGAPVPSQWLSILFDDAAPQAQLGPDGHPAKADFLPPVPLPRRMPGGRRVTYHAAPRIGVIDATDVPVAAFGFAHGGPRVDAAPPPPGADTDAILAELGYDVACAALRGSHAV